jgi:thiol-disulfide isomerase/thioredoxin
MKSFIFALLIAAAAIVEAADLKLKNQNRQDESLADYRGKIVALNFWATWCIPCREEMPMFVQLQDEYGSQGVQFIAASIDLAEDRDKVTSFVREFRLNFPVWLDATLEQQASLGLGTAVPATVILDRDGNPRFRIIGKSTRKDLKKRFDFLISGGIPEPDPLLLPEGISKEHFEQHHAQVGAEGEEHHHEEEGSGGSEVPS